MGVFPQVRHSMRGKWVFPPGKTELVFPGRDDCVYYWILLDYNCIKLGLNANSQEVLATCMNALLNYYCI